MEERKMVYNSRSFKKGKALYLGRGKEALEESELLS